MDFDIDLCFKKMRNIFFKGKGLHDPNLFKQTPTFANKSSKELYAIV